MEINKFQELAKNLLTPDKEKLYEEFDLLIKKIENDEHAISELNKVENIDALNSFNKFKSNLKEMREWLDLMKRLSKLEPLDRS